MATLTVTSRGQITFRKDVLNHLGLRPGDKIQLDLLPHGRAELRAVRAEGAFARLRGMLEGKTNGARLTIEDIDTAIAEGGATAGLGDT